ncbi:aldose 1-epimerase family protein [Flavobacterium agricola]|uniref:Aldose 1-epimerase family protein n=1 Tax=Flavobacterium agricola TaxID=2870839 RepID=A0ABY6M202_9FLAO|nr:aldose 1-epimerase family protein [Flavobacterium agricola]UYW02282.1 aldose 1-epimerase family protein [Flavobacterium agricola]
MITLQNEQLTVNLSALGAELKSITNKVGFEFLWQANPAFWNKTSPILFPIVGSLKNNSYWYNNQEYKLNRHGFAREMLFDYQQTSATQVVFTLQDTDATLVNYPFSFQLQVRYQLQGNQVTCTYLVTNTGVQNMLFSLGAHPAFALPELANGSYYLAFNKDETLARYVLNTEGLVTNQTKNITLNHKTLPLTKPLFYDDALVFKHLKSDCITLKKYRK